VFERSSRCLRGCVWRTQGTIDVQDRRTRLVKSYVRDHRDAYNRRRWHTIHRAALVNPVVFFKADELTQRTRGNRVGNIWQRFETIDNDWRYDVQLGVGKRGGRFDYPIVQIRKTIVVVPRPIDMTSRC